MSVLQFLDLFRQNENKGIVIIPVDDSGRPLTGIAIPRKVLNFQFWLEISEIILQSVSFKLLEMIDF